MLGSLARTGLDQRAQQKVEATNKIFSSLLHLRWDVLRAQGLINERNKKLEQLVNAAAGPAVPLPHTRRTPLERIDLREEACRADAQALGNGPALNALPDITEEGGEGESPLTSPC